MIAREIANKFGKGLQALSSMGKAFGSNATTDEKKQEDVVQTSVEEMQVRLSFQEEL